METCTQHKCAAKLLGLSIVKRIKLSGHTPKQGFVPANPNDFIGRLVTLYSLAHRFHTKKISSENSYFCNRAFPGWPWNAFFGKN